MVAFGMLLVLAFSRAFISLWCWLALKLPASLASWLALDSWLFLACSSCIHLHLGLQACFVLLIGLISCIRLAWLASLSMHSPTVSLGLSTFLHSPALACFGFVEILGFLASFHLPFHSSLVSGLSRFLAWLSSPHKTQISCSWLPFTAFHHFTGFLSLLRHSSRLNHGWARSNGLLQVVVNFWSRKLW